MPKKILLFLFVLSSSSDANAHLEMSSPSASTLDAWLHWLGTFHYLFLHFPIALIIMAAIAEVQFFRTKDALYNYAAAFMLTSGVLMAIPTALFGLALSYNNDYPEPFKTFFFWHRFFGISTVLLGVVTASIRQIRFSFVYFFCLALLVLSISITGFFGGNLAFGEESFIPPIFNKQLKL